MGHDMGHDMDGAWGMTWTMTHGGSENCPARRLGGSVTASHDREAFHRFLPDLPQACGGGLPAVLLQAVRRRRPQPMAQWRLCGAGPRGGGRGWRGQAGAGGEGRRDIVSLCLAGGAFTGSGLTEAICRPPPARPFTAACWTAHVPL